MHEPLSEREIEILRLAANGCANGEIKLLSPQAMLTQLDSFWLEMKRTTRNIPARQQTLRHTIEWGYRFLDEEDRRLFAESINPAHELDFADGVALSGAAGALVRLAAPHAAQCLGRGRGHSTCPGHRYCGDHAHP